MSKTVEEHLARVWMLRAFLEKVDDFYTPDEADELLTRYEEPFAGLDFAQGCTGEIYSGNLCRLWGRKPSEVDVGAAASAAEKAGHTDVATL